MLLPKLHEKPHMGKKLKQNFTVLLLIFTSTCVKWLQHGTICLNSHLSSNKKHVIDRSFLLLRWTQVRLILKLHWFFKRINHNNDQRAIYGCDAHSEAKKRDIDQSYCTNIRHSQYISLKCPYKDHNHNQTLNRSAKENKAVDDRNINISKNNY